MALPLDLAWPGKPFFRAGRGFASGAGRQMRQHASAFDRAIVPEVGTFRRLSTSWNVATLCA